MTGRLREIAEPFVAAAPAGAGPDATEGLLGRRGRPAGGGLAPRDARWPWPCRPVCGRTAGREGQGAVAGGAQAHPHRRLVIAVGGRDHPHQRGRVAARRPEPPRREGHPPGPHPAARRQSCAAARGYSANASASRTPASPKASGDGNGSPRGCSSLPTARRTRRGEMPWPANRPLVPGRLVEGPGPFRAAAGGPAEIDRRRGGRERRSSRRRH